MARASARHILVETEAQCLDLKQQIDDGADFADLACTPSHAQRLFDAVAHDDKEHHDVKGADHYYIERPDLLPDAVRICTDWLSRKGFE